MNKRNSDNKTLVAMVGIYCRDKHGTTGAPCPECQELLDYAELKLSKCPFGENKPTCAKCTIHCYTPAMRTRIREIMKYSGPRMLTSHPILAARHLVQGLLRKPPQRPIKKS